jgi:type I restriction enzyme S subunit
MPVLSATTMKKLVLAKPQRYEQKTITEALECHDARIHAEEKYRDKLKLQKKGLMHDLLTGKVRVKV